MTHTTTETSPTDTVREAVDQGREVAGAAAGEARDVASTAVEQAREVAGVATEQAASVASQAVDQARTVVGGATDEVREQLEQRLRDLAGAARDTAGELQALCEGRPDDAGRSRDLARQASGHLERMADRAEELGVQGVVEEVGDFARRRPLVFLAGAAAAGVVVGRLAKAGRATSGGGVGAPAPGGALAGEAHPPPGGTGMFGEPTTLPPPAPTPLPPPADAGPGGAPPAWAGA